MKQYILPIHLITNGFSLLISTLKIIFHSSFMNHPFTYHKRKILKKQSNWKQPCILLFHRDLIWSKPIRHELPAVAHGLEESGTKALSALSSFSKRTLRCWEAGHLVVTLHFSHCVQAPARQELWSAHIDLGPQTLTLFSYLLSPLSSATLEMECFVYHWKGLHYVYVRPDLSSSVGCQGQRLPSPGRQNALE